MKAIKTIIVESENVKVSPTLQTTTFKVTTTLEGNEKITSYFDYSFFISQYFYWKSIQHDLPPLPTLQIFHEINDSEEEDDLGETSMKNPEEAEKAFLSKVTAILMKCCESKKLLKDVTFIKFLAPLHGDVQSIIGSKRKSQLSNEKPNIESKPYKKWNHSDVIEWFTVIGCKIYPDVYQTSLGFSGKDFDDPNFYNATIYIKVGPSKDDSKDLINNKEMQFELEKYIFKSEYYRLLKTKVYRKVSHEKGNVHFIENINLRNWGHKEIFTWLNEIGLYDDYKDFFIVNRILGDDIIKEKDVIFEKAYDEDSNRPLKIRKFFKIFVEQVLKVGCFSISWLNIRKKLSEFTSVSTPQMISITDTLNNKEKFIEKYMNKKELMEKIDIPFQDTFEKKVKIKLILTDQLRSKKERGMRQLLSPLLNVLPVKSFGMFHSALVVGPYYLQWTTSEIIIPKTFESYSAFFAADITEINVQNGNLDKIIDILGEVCIKWNRYYTYNQYGMKKNTGNCQHFVNDVFKNIGLDIKFQGVLKKFFDSIKKSGKTDMVFEPSQKFIRKFNLKKKKYTFLTHKDLDDFCNTIEYLHLPEFKEERFLLKAFDRSFWLRHFKDETDPNFAPTDSKKGCYFENPKTTGSYF